MRPRTRLRLETMIPVVSMADIAFLLIIFFLLTSTFAREAGFNIRLPTATAAKETTQQRVVVSVNAADEVFVNGNRVSVDALEPTLRDALTKSGSSNVTIDGDSAVPYGRVVFVMDAAKSVGAEKLTLSARLEKRVAGSEAPAPVAAPGR
jgi:biopolymer transport protein ExbD